MNPFTYFYCIINNVDAHIYFNCLKGGYNKLETSHNISDQSDIYNNIININCVINYM